MSINRKNEKLVRHLKELGSLVVAFSGGVDSTFLLAVANEILGEKVIAVTAVSPLHPDREIAHSRNAAKTMGIRQLLFHTEEMNISNFVRNEPERCFYCKQHMLQAVFKIAHKEGIQHVAHGANTDDLRDFRPGLKAAQELGVIAPLIDAGLTKKEIRMLSKQMGLPTWDKASMACLATRIPYGDKITLEKLKMIDGAEGFLLDQGFRQVRVRKHGPVARIELGGEDIIKITDAGIRKLIVNKFLEIGFLHICVDLEDYISGNMNRHVNKAP